MRPFINNQSWANLADGLKETVVAPNLKHLNVYSSTPHLKRGNNNYLSEEKKKKLNWKDYDYLRFQSKKLKEEINSIHSGQSNSAFSKKIVDGKVEEIKSQQFEIWKVPEQKYSTPKHCSNQEQIDDLDVQVYPEANEFKGDLNNWNEFDSLDTGHEEESEVRESISLHSIQATPSKANLNENLAINYTELQKKRTKQV